MIELDAGHDRYELKPYVNAAAMCQPRWISDYLYALGSELTASGE